MLSSRALAASAAVALALALALAGCGSGDAGDLPPAATPVASPPLEDRPAGRVRPLDPRLEGLLDRAAGVAVGGGRTFRLQAHAHTLTAEQDGRVVARARTGLDPGAVVVTEDGDRVAVLSRRERVVDVFDAETLEREARVDVGIGPVALAAGGQDRLYAVDSIGNGLLLLRLDPEPRLDRRLHLEGRPWSIAVDPERGELFVTLLARNQVMRIRGGNKPGRIRTYPSVRQPERVDVDDAGRVHVIGRADRVEQTFDP